MGTVTPQGRETDPTENLRSDSSSRCRLEDEKRVVLRTKVKPMFYIEKLQIL